MNKNKFYVRKKSIYIYMILYIYSVLIELHILHKTKK